MRGRLLRLVGAAILAGLASGVAADGAAARTIRAADDGGEDALTVQALYLFGRVLSDRTAGRHKVLVFHSRQLGEERDTIEQTRAGAIDLARVSTVSLARYVPAADVLNLPYLFRSEAHMQAVLDGPVGRELLAAFRDAGFEGLAFLPAGIRVLYTARRPIRTPADLAGLRIRVQDSVLAAETASAFGAMPVMLGFGQVGPALRLGLVDGAEATWDAYLASGHNLVAPFVAETGHARPPDVLLMSQREWDSLDPADQAVVREAARRASGFLRERREARAAEARAAAIATGTTIAAELDRPTFARVVAPVRDRALDDARIGALAARILADPTP